jgi:trans-aconitate 3-methyltransferase
MSTMAEPDKAKQPSLWQHRDQDFWKLYLSVRPKYPSAFYDRILEYHDSVGNGSKEKAYDIGTGPGQVAEVLTKHFNHVIATDISGSHLEAARLRLTTSIEAGKASIVPCLGEDLAEHVSPESGDLITVAECMPLIDPEKGVDGWGTVLKPGGTLAIWFYGRPLFVSTTDPTALDDKCNAIYSDIVDKLFRRALHPRDDPSKVNTSRASICMHNWLDNVKLDSSSWENVRRHKWNPDYELSFYDPSLGGAMEVPKVSNIGPHEKYTQELDRGFWGENWGIEEVKTFVKCNLPAFGPWMGEQEYVELFAKLEGTMGGSGAKRRITWPVVLILATRK